jgi:hypothetical protein
MMRHLVAAVVWGWAACAYPAAFDGSFLIDDAQSRIVAKLEEKGERLMGTIEFGGQGRINLVGTIKNNTARGSATSKDGTGEFEARIDGDTLSLTISQKEGPNQKAARLPLLFQRAGSHANNGGGDARLVGHWSYQNLIVSGNASFASEEHIVFRADGSYVYGKGATTAGASDWSYDSGQDGDREHGFWRAENRVLFVSDGRGWTRVGTYGMTDDGAAMRITYDGGGKKLWSRARER